MNQTNGGFEAAQQMANLWMEYVTKMGTAGMAFRAGDAPTDASRSMRDAGFTAMEQTADRFMRTPQFLEMMKQSLDASIAFRKQLNDFFTEAQHSVQGVARRDMDGMTRAIRRMETRVLGRLEELCERIDRMSQRIDALEGVERSPEGSDGHSSDQPVPRTTGSEQPTG